MARLQWRLTGKTAGNKIHEKGKTDQSYIICHLTKERTTKLFIYTKITKNYDQIRSRWKALKEVTRSAKNASKAGPLST